MASRARLVGDAVRVWKTCGRFVETLWTDRHEKKVEASFGRIPVTKTERRHPSFTASLESL
jgi:hypothetical protein